MNYDASWLHIDLDALEGNLRSFREKSGAKVMAVLKADAYGFGARPLGRHLEGASDFYGVSRVDEALELRREGVKLPILILGGVVRDTYPLLIQNGIRPTIYRWEDALAFSQAAQALGVEAPCHFAVDTGMSRIGLQPGEAELCAKMAALPGLVAEGIFSHYATADAPDLTAARAQQARFDAFVAQLKDLGVEPPLVHLSNSAGAMVFARQYGMVRAGILLYGTLPGEHIDPRLLPAQLPVTWCCRVTHVKTVPAGTAIGYGATYTADRQTRVATLSVGYADGYLRGLSNRFYVLIHGRRCPILGRVCMDQMMVDVTGVPQVEVGDRVVLLGTDGEETITPAQMAGAVGTIAHELTCGFARRVPRYYLRGGRVVEELRYTAQ